MRARITLATLIILALAIVGPATGGARLSAAAPQPTTPIQHLIVIFQENVSFDHYFATYPSAANTDGTPFAAKPGTPAVNGLDAGLRTSNPNSAQPQRLGGPGQIITCDMNHSYTAEQQAFNAGQMDKFVEYTGSGDCTGGAPGPYYYRPGLVMDYYDGNTVTAMWNYAQRFALSDNFFGTTFGPSTPGALNLISGQTYGVISVGQDRQPTTTPSGFVTYPSAGSVGTVISDPDPAWDDCSNPSADLAAMQGQNIGDLLNAAGVSWGWFQGGFRPTSYSGTAYDSQPKAICAATHANYAGVTIGDYSAHHAPFQYYQSTANPHHLPPSSVAMIGQSDQANHQYDLADFYAALDAGSLPAVSFLKAPSAQDGHAGYSSPLDEQQFIVGAINAVQQSAAWASTAVIIAYDDSDGWYDHVSAPRANSSSGAYDALTASGACGSGAPLGGYQGRCGYGPRLPLLAISPYSRANFVDSTLTDQTSILRFIEDNWLGGQRIGGGSFDALAGSLDGMFSWGSPNSEALLLNPRTGAPWANQLFLPRLTR